MRDMVTNVRIALNMKKVGRLDEARTFVKEVVEGSGVENNKLHFTGHRFLSQCEKQNWFLTPFVSSAKEDFMLKVCPTTTLDLMPPRSVSEVPSSETEKIMPARTTLDLTSHR